MSKGIKAQAAVVREDPMIQFIDMPGKRVMIIGLINFLTEEGMTAKWNEHTTNAYDEYPTYVFLRYRRDGCKQLIITSSLQEVPKVIDIGDCLDRKVFGKIISEVKKSGKLLHDITEAMTHNPIKTITI